MDIEKRREKLLFRSWHCGFRELDLVLGRFAEREAGRFDAAACAAFEALLGYETMDLFNWIMGVQEAPESARGEMMERVRRFALEETQKGEGV